MTGDKRWDILGIGTATVDDLFYLDSFPVPDTKTPILGSERQGGGPTATALVAASRLGLGCAFGGMLGDDEFSRWIESDLAGEGIDVSPVVRYPDARPIHANIIVEQAHHTRTILFTRNQPDHADDGLPDTETIRAARMLLFDDCGAVNMIPAATIAREAAIPVVADLEQRPDPALLALPDHLIVPKSFAARATGEGDPGLAARKLWRPDRSAVIITCGADGCWYLAADGQVVHQPAFNVDVVDTTGCGDVFHGAYSAALTWGYSLAERIRFASAAAALKATRPGGRRGIANRSQVEAFVQSASPQNRFPDR